MTRNEFIQKAIISMAGKVIGTNGITDSDDWRNLVDEARNLADETEDCFGFDEEEEEVRERRCVIFKAREDGEIDYHAVQAADEKLVRGGTKLMHDCAKVFSDFRNTHPEVTEMHFYTDDEVSVEE